MATVQQIITDSLQDAGILAANETPNATDSQKMFRLLNRMMDTWSTEDLMIYNNVQEVFSLVAGQQTYTLGPGGDFNTTRPIDITQAAMRDTNGNDLTISIWDYEEYSVILSKPVQSSIALGIYYNAGFPLSEITLWPVVTGSTYRLVLWSWKRLTDFTALNDTIVLAPGYEDAIESNLALKACIAFQAPVPDGLAIWANESKAQIKRINVNVPELGFPTKLVGVSAGTFPISPHILTGY